MNIPTTLKHKPVIIAANYESVDGRSAGKSEAKGLSVGLAQWNERGHVDVSAKVWRYTGNKWSRQSEELPLHRVLDLAVLIAKTQAYIRECYRMPKLYDPEHPVIDRVGLQGDAMTVQVCTENPMIDEDIRLLRDVMSRDDEMISERLAVLARTLRDLGY